MAVAMNRRAGLLGMLALLVGWACSVSAQSPQVAQKPVGKIVTQQEFAALEARVAALEERALRDASASTVGSGSAVLERKVGEEASTTAPQLPPGRAAWRKLRKGMRMDDVRSILGEPTRVDIIFYTNWYYVIGHTRGEVQFYNERVERWSEP